MGIRENYKVLKKALQHFHYKRFYTPSESTEKPYFIENINDLKKGIKLLSEIDFLKPYIQDLRDNSGLFNTSKDIDNFTSTQDTVITSNIDILKTGIEVLLEYFKTQTNKMILMEFQSNFQS